MKKSSVTSIKPAPLRFLLNMKNKIQHKLKKKGLFNLLPIKICKTFNQFRFIDKDMQNFKSVQVYVKTSFKEKISFKTSKQAMHPCGLGTTRVLSNI